MQWNADRNGGFSTARPAKLRNPVTPGGFGPDHVNVAEQRRDPDSLLAFVRTLIRHYRNGRELGWGAFDVLEQPDKAVLAHTLTVGDRVVIAVHNFASEPREVELVLPLAQEARRLTDVFTGEQTTLESNTLSVSLDGYGYRWLRLTALDDTGLY